MLKAAVGRWLAGVMGVLVIFLTCIPKTSHKLLIAACGDSITASSYGSYLPSLRIFLQRSGYRVEIDCFARPGNNSLEYLQFLERKGLVLKKYDYLLIMLGTNDVRIDGDFQIAEQFIKNIEKIVNFLTNRYPQTKIVLITPPPILKIDLPTFNENSQRRLSEEIVPSLRAMSSKKKTGLVDLQKELARKDYLFSGIHPNQAGFRSIGQIIGRFIVEQEKMGRGSE